MVIYVIMAGLQQLIEAIKDMHFSKGDIDYLRTLNMFDEEFLSYLADFKFDGTIWLSLKEHLYSLMNH